MFRFLVALLVRRMVVKIFAALGLVVGATLLVLTWRQSNAEIAALQAETRDSAKKVADAMIGSIEHTMLEGNGVVVKELVRSVKGRVPEAEIRIYDPRGVEVFGEKPAAPARASLPPDVAASLGDGVRREAGGTTVHPIANERRCHECHDPKMTVRGVLAMRIAAGAGASRGATMATLVEDAFVRVMTGKKQELLDDYFKDLVAAAPGVTGVAVYDATGSRHYGTAIAGLTGEMLAPSLQPGAPRTRLPRAEGGHLEIVPLPMQKRCAAAGCHAESDRVRGVLALAIAELPAQASAAAELEAVLDRSLRTIMMSSLGRMIAGFLDRAASTGAVSDLTLYDDAGRTFYATTRPAPAPHVVEALAASSMMSELLEDRGDEKVRIVQKLANAEPCMRCHGDDAAARGAVAVTLSTANAAELRSMARRRAAMFVAFALVTILLLLYGLLGYLVIRPVRQIGDVAEAVGRGNLDIEVQRAAPDGDEVSRLGDRINHMIKGLRTEYVMRRFVSKGTAAAAARGAAPSQMRRTTTVLFTDIRGFTAYSETVPPERVVDMLNRLLQIQADLVDRHRGDIDKYVGDELMAVFEGDDADARAVSCALEMVEAVDRLRTEAEPMRVGAGVSRGEVVHGPIGSRDRQDFTVIGDVVNIGARLCSAAAGGEVLVSAPVRAACEASAGLAFESLDPLPLKGKREPLTVFRAVRPSTRAAGGET